MTRIELRDILDERVGWKQPTNSPYTVSAANLTSEGGRYFQDEHAFVKISTLHAIMEEAGADDTALNVYLADLRKQVTLLVVDEVFADMDINTITVTDYENQFDAAISKRMVMKVAEILFASARSNRTERLSKQALEQFFFDVNGDPSFPNKVSISQLYEKELKYLRDTFNTDDMLDVATLTTIDTYNEKNYLRFE